MYFYFCRNSLSYILVNNSLSILDQRAKLSWHSHPYEKFSDTIRTRNNNYEFVDTMSFYWTEISFVYSYMWSKLLLSILTCYPIHFCYIGSAVEDSRQSKRRRMAFHSRLFCRPQYFGWLLCAGVPRSRFWAWHSFAWNLYMFYA